MGCSASQTTAVEPMHGDELTQDQVGWFFLTLKKWHTLMLNIKKYTHGQLHFRIY